MDLEYGINCIVLSLDSNLTKKKKKKAQQKIKSNFITRNQELKKKKKMQAYISGNN